MFYAAIQRTYVLGEGLCGTPNPELIIIVGDRVEGPGFSCEAFSRVPGAGTGMEEFQVACMMDGQKVEGVLTLDLGNAADHFSLLLPRAGDWFSLYTCDNPHLLK